MSDADLLDPPAVRSGSRSRSSDADLLDPPPKPRAAREPAPTFNVKGQEERAKLRGAPVAAAAPAANLSTFDQIPGAAPGQIAPPAEQQWTNKPASTADTIIGGAETAGAVLSGAFVGAPLGALNMVENAGRRGLYNLAGIDTARLPTTAQALTQGMSAGTYAPRTEEGRSQMQDLMSSDTMRALSAVAPLRQVQLAAASVPVGMLVRDVAGKVRSAGQTVADQFATREPMARVEPTMGPPRYVVRDGKIVRKDTVTAGPDVLGEARAGAEQPIRGPTGAPVSAVDPVDALPSQQRMDILRRVMPEATVRNSVLSGDVNAAAADAQHAKFAMAGKPGAAELQSAIQSERTGLQSFAERMAKETGGTLGMDESSRIARARTIDAPIQGLRKWFDDKVGGLYKAADEKAGGQPVAMQGFGEALRDKSLQYNSDTVHLSPAIEAYAKKIGMVAEDGSISGTVKQAEMLRKELNKRWSKQNSGLVEALKDSIDQDVFSAAGADIYGKAREVFTLKKQTLENPNGIARMFDIDPRNPMNRAVPLEQLPDKVLSLSADQLAHVTDVLRKLPPELQAKGQQALAELRAHFVNKVADAGNSTKTVWNQKAVARMLDDNTATAADLFKEQPALIQKLKDLRDAGAITTAEDRSYPGAAAQFELGKARGVTSLVDKAVQFGPAFTAAQVPVAGAYLVPGAQALGERAVARRIATRAAKDAEKRVTRLSDVGK